MAWVVDTSVLIDVLDDDPQFGALSARALDAHSSAGLVICPVTYAELAPAFAGHQGLQDEFLEGVGVSYREDWLWQDTLQAHAAWYAHVQRRRIGREIRRSIADILIGSFALRFHGLITRNAKDFRAAFPALALRVPEAEARELEDHLEDHEASTGLLEEHGAEDEAGGFGQASAKPKP